MPSPTAPAPRDAGFTLLETLVVLILVSVLAGTAMLSLPGRGADPGTAREAALLATRLDRAAAHAMETARPARLVWDMTGYRFEEWDGAGWGAHALPHLAARHALAKGRVTAADGGPDGYVDVHPDLRPPADGPVLLRLSDGAGGVAVRFDGLGATTEAGT